MNSSDRSFVPERYHRDGLSGLDHFPELLVLFRSPWAPGILCACDHFTTRRRYSDRSDRMNTNRAATPLHAMAWEYFFTCRTQLCAILLRGRSRLTGCIRTRSGDGPAGWNRGIHTTILTNGDRRRRVCVGSGLRVLRNLMNHRQLQHGSLAGLQRAASRARCFRLEIQSHHGDDAAHPGSISAPNFPTRKLVVLVQSHLLSYLTSSANASSVPRSMQTATAGSLSDAKPRVEVPRNVVVISVSPTRAGRVSTAWRL